MKKSIIVILALLILYTCSAMAETTDYSMLTDEELAALRDAKLAELTTISTEIGRRNHSAATAADNESLGKFKDLFPDEVLAMIIRDKCAKFSIEQTVTQAELDKITSLRILSTAYGRLSDLTGIGHLRNLKSLESYYYDGESLPEDLCTLQHLESLSIWVAGNYGAGYIKLAVLPESIGNLTSLKCLDLQCCSITELPESIGNLNNLEYLNVNHTYIAALPESIGNLTKLKELHIGYTSITELPESIWSLTLDKLYMGGLPIK